MLRWVGRSSAAWRLPRLRRCSCCRVCSLCCKHASPKERRRLIRMIPRARTTCLPLRKVSEARMTNDQTPMTRQIQNQKSKILNAAIVAVAIVCGYAIASHAQQASGPLEVVVAGKPTRKTLALITTQPARIEALEQTPIHSKMAAYVGQVLVDFGDNVKKDQPLLKLTAPEIDAEVAQKRALLEQARAQILQAEAGARASDAAVNTAHAKSIQSEAASERA